MDREGSAVSALRNSKKLRASGRSFLRTHVGLSSNVVLVDVDGFLDNALLESGIDPVFSHAEFGQISDAVSRFALQGLEHIVVVMHMDSLIENLPWNRMSSSVEGLLEVVTTRCQGIIDASREVSGATRVHVAGFAGGTDSRSNWPSLRRLALAEFERQIRAASIHLSCMRLVDIQSQLEEQGLKTTLDAHRLAHYSAPLTSTGARVVAAAIAQDIVLSRSIARKVLVLDADNTLWGGILGTDGVGGVQLHPTQFPGNIFFRVQSVFLELKEKGALLALVTKNERADVVDMFSSHPSCVLKESDFVVFRASWNPKVEAIREIAEELSLDLSSFVFLDDSDVEIAAVREQLPMIESFQVPELSGYAALASAISEKFDLRGEGSNIDRTGHYQLRSSVKELERQSKSRDQFLEGLETIIKVSLNDPNTFARVAELSRRTNQFNLSLDPFTLNQLEALVLDSKADVIAYDVYDKFGPSGICGAAVMRFDPELTVEGLWISCRVLGRGIERAIFAHLGRLASGYGRKHVCYTFRQGARNHQVLHLLTDLAVNSKYDEGGGTFVVENEHDLGEGKWVEVAES